MQRSLVLLLAVVCVLATNEISAQGLTGALIGTVRDAHGGVLPGAVVRVTSPALIGGSTTTNTNAKGQLLFLALPPGVYMLEIALQGFRIYREEGIRIGAGASISRGIELSLAGVAESIVVPGSRADARDPGFGTRFLFEDLKATPWRRSAMFDPIRASPGISPTSPSSSTVTTVSAFGSGTNENQFHIDGTPTTCPCNGVARAEPSIDVIQEVHVKSIGASVEFGNMQGAVVNVITRQGSDRFLYDASYYAQPAGLTSHPVRLSFGTSDTAYERARYQDVSTGLGGPAIRNRLWFFAGYQHVRDYDSQPGTDPALPRTNEQDKVFGKLTWKLSPGVQLMQSVHDEFWVRPDPPTRVTPWEATLHRSATVPTITFGHLTHVVSANTVWEARAGRFVYTEEREPSTGTRAIANHSDKVTGVSSGAPPQVGGLMLARTTAKANITHYEPGLLGADHQWKAGGQLERGEQHGVNVIPTGVRFEDKGGLPSQAVSSDPSHTGGLFVTAAAFASDTLSVRDRLTIDAGVRFDHNRAISQDLHALDADGRETDQIVHGLGTMYTWNVLSPRLGATTKLTADGRTIWRVSYGRFYQGVLTGEFSGFHPGVTLTTTTDFNPATGEYTLRPRVVDPRKNLILDPDIRPPYSDELSTGVDREIGRGLSVAMVYVHKSGSDYIGWTDVGGKYHQETRTLPDGRALPVFVLDNAPADRRFQLTNPDGYSMTYDGLAMTVDKRRSHGWQASGSYTYSRVSGLQASSGTTAGGAQASTVAAPTPTFGRDPNDTTNARGRLPNDRPHMFRVMGSFDVPRTHLVVAAHLQYFSGKPWAATAQMSLPQGDRPVLLEPRGSRRLPSQTLLDVRLSRPMALGDWGRIDLLLDVLNALNDVAVESLETETLMTETAISAAFGQPATFVDPRRVMLGVRLNLGR